MTTEADLGAAGPALPRPKLELLTEVALMPEPAEVAELYIAASARPPLHEPPAVGHMFAELYADARQAPGALTVTARSSGRLVGFGYGHEWKWAAETDAWAAELRERLAEHAPELDGSFALHLLCVSPEHMGRGLGRQLLDGIIEHDRHPRAWLQTTDVDSPARRLYERCGWRRLGHGPAAPNGAPGLVMILRRPESGAG
jgi:GNAT superfamily N-acetyltransferase